MQWIINSVLLLAVMAVVSAQSYTIGGSSTVYPVSLAMVEDYAIEFGDASFDVLVNGTGGGFIRFCEGELALTGASRAIKPEEIETCQEKGVSFIELPFAFDALTVAVSPNVDFLECLSVADLKALFEAGSSLKTWQDLDSSFPEDKIHFYAPGQDSGTYDYFSETIVGGESRVDVLSSEDDELLVEGLREQANSIAYFGYAYYLANQENIRALSIDGGAGCVAPSQEHILEGSYQPLSRPLFIYVNVASLDEHVEALVNLFLGQETRFLIKDTGYAVLPEEAYSLAQLRLNNRLTGSSFQDFKAGMSVVDALQ